MWVDVNGYVQKSKRSRSRSDPDKKMTMVLQRQCPDTNLCDVSSQQVSLVVSEEWN